MGSTTGRALRIAATAWGYIGWLYLRRLGWIKPAESPAERFARTLVPTPAERRRQEAGSGAPHRLACYRLSLVRLGRQLAM